MKLDEPNWIATQPSILFWRYGKTHLSFDFKVDEGQNMTYVHRKPRKRLSAGSPSRAGNIYGAAPSRGVASGEFRTFMPPKWSPHVNTDLQCSFSRTIFLAIVVSWPIKCDVTTLALLIFEALMVRLDVSIIQMEPWANHRSFLFLFPFFFLPCSSEVRLDLYQLTSRDP